MSFLFRLRCLNLFIKVVFPDRHRQDTLMGSTPVPRVNEDILWSRKRWKRPPGGVPDFVDDLTDDEVRPDAWLAAIEDPDTIANTRAFLIHQWNRK